jgi:PAS domain S-box-containing protein
MKLLLLEDSAAVAELTVEQLRSQGLSVEWEHVQTADAFATRLDATFEAVIADYHVPGTVVRSTLATTRERAPDVPYIVISAEMSAEEGVELMRLGALDYLHKDRLERLGQSLLKGLEHARERVASRLAEAKYRELFEHFPVGVVRYGPTGVLVEVNPALLAILDFPDEGTYRRATSASFADFIHQAVQAEIAQQLERDGVVRGFETEVARRDGSPLWVSIDITRIHGEEGAVTFIDSAVTNINDRKNAEAEREIAVEELRWSDNQRRQLLRSVISAQEEERLRIAQGIHDDAVQVMTAANIRLATLGRKLDDPALSGEIDHLIDAISLSTGRLRDLLFELQPPALARSGLAAALREQLTVVCRDTPMTCELTDALTHEPSPEVGLLIYRIAQEALANVRKHAMANAVKITIAAKDDGILVRILDDGRGFEPLEHRHLPPHGHMGLASMVERAQLVGGWCVVESTIGAGTTVAIWVPTGGGGVVALRG